MIACVGLWEEPTTEKNRWKVMTKPALFLEIEVEGKKKPTTTYLGDIKQT